MAGTSCGPPAFGTIGDASRDTLGGLFDLLRSLDSAEMFPLLCGGAIATPGVVWIGLR